MTDRFTEITTKSYGTRISDSIKRVVVGIILFIVSIGLLYWNEGRVDLSAIAKKATEIDSSTVISDSSFAGKLISTTGVVNSDQVVGDNLFLKPGKFTAVERRVEMYSWKEDTKSRTKSSTGGKETSETTYTYKKSWEEKPSDSSKFRYPEDHENPEKSLDSFTNKVNAATVGTYNFDPQTITLPDFTQLSLNAENVTLKNKATLANENHIYIRKGDSGTLDSPKIGDLRISYHVLRPGFTGTIFGKLNDGRVEPYFDKDGTQLYHLLIGTREQAIATLHTEYTTQLWLFRLAGFLLMWFGLWAMFGPISVILDFLPIFGSLSRVIIGLVTFIAALVLSMVTIIISAILHNVVALIIVLCVSIGVTIGLLTRLKKKKTGTAIPAVAVSEQAIPSANQLDTYVLEARKGGMTDDQIRQELLNSGWSSDDINKVLQ